MQETKRLGLYPWVRKIPWKGKAAHCSILAWRIPWMKGPGRLWYIRSKRVRHN